MAKPYFAEYVNHCLRFYARVRPPIEFKSEVDRLNWHSVDKALLELSRDQREIIVDIYSRGDTLADNIYQVSRERTLDQDGIWNLVTKLTKDIARERALI